MPTYAITYTGHDNYYGRLPLEPICNHYDTAANIANKVDDGTLPDYVKTIHIEHRECGEPVEYCGCEEVQHERGL